MATNVYFMHDDLIIAPKTINESKLAVQEVMKAIDTVNLTFNPKNVFFGKTEIAFWGMIFSSSRVRADPKTVKALENLPPPKNRRELKSFICVMQSNSDFIPDFLKSISRLRELLKSGKQYKWTDTYQNVFKNVLDKFKKKTLLSCFNISKATFIFIDAHQSGLFIILV